MSDRYKDMLFEARKEIDGELFVPLKQADHIIDQIYDEVDCLEIDLLQRMITRLKKQLD